MIVNEYLAMVQMNSCWAMDPNSYRMMVVGDQGKAILFDAKMGAQFRPKSALRNGDFGEIKEKKAVHNKRVPVYAPNIDFATGEKAKWGIVIPWFTAHTFSKTEPKYVNIVKYSQAGNMFITSTNFGEVKLWDNQQCIALGILNTHEFSPARVLKYIKHSNEQDELIYEATEAVQKEISNSSRKIR